MLRENAFFSSLFNDGADFFFDPSARGLTNEFVLLGEHLIHHVVIVALVEIGPHAFNRLLR